MAKRHHDHDSRPAARGPSPQFMAIVLLVLVAGSAGALWMLANSRKPEPKAAVPEAPAADPFEGMPAEEPPPGRY